VGFFRPWQSYEGGLGGEPWNEAHGGYTFCGLAALVLLGRADALDVPQLLHWAAWRQVRPGDLPSHRVFHLQQVVF
jgi:protein farnesyltransferase subunit beta